MELERAVKVLIVRYETRIDIELAEEVKAAKRQDELAEAMAKGALQALRSLRPSIQQIHYVLYPTAQERLGFVLEPLKGQDLAAIRNQIRTLKANEQYRTIGLLAQRALDFWEVENGGKEE